MTSQQVLDLVQKFIEAEDFGFASIGRRGDQYHGMILRGRWSVYGGPRLRRDFGERYFVPVWYYDQDGAVIREAATTIAVGNMGGAFAFGEWGPEWVEIDSDGKVIGLFSRDELGDR